MEFKNKDQLWMHQASDLFHLDLFHFVTERQKKNSKLTLQMQMGRLGLAGSLAGGAPHQRDVVSTLGPLLLDALSQIALQKCLPNLKS